MERRLKLQRSSTEPVADIVVQIGHPRWIQPDFEAACPVAIRGGTGRVSDIRGIDFIDASFLSTHI
jgi:hypothetical protein